MLNEGKAGEKFQAICEAQSGMTFPRESDHRYEICSDRNGKVAEIDNRRLALVAKLAGAPVAPVAGVDMHVRKDDVVEKNQPLYTIHAESPGELEYALDYLSGQTGIISVQTGD